jgi:hypothetical protein
MNRPAGRPPTQAEIELRSRFVYGGVAGGLIVVALLGLALWASWDSTDLAALKLERQAGECVRGIASLEFMTIETTDGSYVIAGKRIVPKGARAEIWGRDGARYLVIGGGKPARIVED